MTFARKLIAASIAASMVSAPALAQSADTAIRTNMSAGEESNLEGDGSGIIIAILAAAAIIAGIIIAAGGSNDTPTSP